MILGAAGREWEEVAAGETRRDQGRINDMETSPLPGREEGLRETLPIRLRLLSRVWKMTQEGLVSLLGGLSQSWSQI